MASATVPLLRGGNLCKVDSTSTLQFLKCDAIIAVLNFYDQSFFFSSLFEDKYNSRSDLEITSVLSRLTDCFVKIGSDFFRVIQKNEINFRRMGRS